MDSKKTSSSKATKAQSREDRLKAALKANMGRRKAQAKARSASESEQKPAESNEG
jgi:hypothetical protein